MRIGIGFVERPQGSGQSSRIQRVNPSSPSPTASAKMLAAALVGSDDEVDAVVTEKYDWRRTIRVEIHRPDLVVNAWASQARHRKCRLYWRGGVGERIAASEQEVPA
jgi:hypothetical protein